MSTELNMSPLNATTLHQWESNGGGWPVRTPGIDSAHPSIPPKDRMPPSSLYQLSMVTPDIVDLSKYGGLLKTKTKCLILKVSHFLKASPGTVAGQMASYSRDRLSIRNYLP
jgi:hypothetical protein